MLVKKNPGLCILLLVLSGYYSSNAYAIADLKCGKIGKYVLEIPKRFVLSWYEQKDKVLSDKLDGKPGSRCGATISKLSMAMTWPGKKLVDNVDYIKDGKMYETVHFSLARLESSDGDLMREVKEFLGAVIKESDRPVRYNEKLDMFVVQRVDRNDPVTARVYYWQERQGEGEIAAMLECLWSIKLEEFYLCRGNFAFAEAGLSVDLLFSEEKLWEWQKIADAIKETVLSKVK